MVARESTPGWTEFDVASVNVQLDKVWGARRAKLVGAAVFAVAFFLVFLITDLPEIRSGSISGVRLAALVIVGGFLVLMLQAFITGIRSVLGGGMRVGLNDQRIEIAFRNRHLVVTDWADRKLRVDLYDMTGIPPDRMLARIGYTIHLKGYVVAISSEAFGDILERSRKQGMVDRVHTGTSWIYPAGAAPTIHSIRHPTDSRPKL
jgi:hypothetical protein